MSTPESTSTPPATDGIAIIGLAVRFPGADSVEAFWENLRAGKETVSFFSDDELRAAGVDPALIADPRYVKANGVLQGADEFDAGFFGMTPREAEATDPQHRVLLETAWEAIERAGYDSARVRGRVGVFAGAGMSTYLLKNLAPNRAFVESAGELALLLGNNKDFAPTRISYKLNLRGPSVAVNTACSTSLVATHFACQSLLDYHCDMALAGGVAVQVPQVQGYLHTEGSIGSPDGHCRAFDAQARGTVSGNGVGLLVLKRLADALADGDTIHAVIRGSAVNNDGADKIGFTAPSVEGQAQVIAEAQAVAGVTPADVSYVEAHGTGTELGDPIEVAALAQVFGDGQGRAAKCALGSVKTNFGHLDEAAGVAGLVKTVLALQHRALPPSLHFTAPNPKIDFARSAFAVNASLAPWASPAGVPRRAGVSSFGIGGTNAHVVLEEAPPVTAGDKRPETGDRRPQLIVLSAKTATALAKARKNLAAHFATEPAIDLADAAYTLALGRRQFAHRCAILASDAAEAARHLRGNIAATLAPDAPREVVFMFSGQGSQHPGMLAGLYASQPVVRATVDRCAEILRPQLGFDLREVLAPGARDAAARLRRTAVAQPAIFVADYALAQLWLSWGVKPAALIGHSLGEYVAACVAGVFTLEDALTLVAARGALMETQPAGAMLAVALAENEAVALGRTHGLELAAVNAPGACVLSGAETAVEQAAAELTGRGVAAKRLETSHAFHSAMMEAVRAPFAAKVRAISRSAPQIPIVSNLTGKWLSAAEATDPEYWARHLRAPVRFADGIALLRGNPARVLLEVGPGRALAAMAQRSAGQGEAPLVVTSARHAEETTDDLAHILAAAGRLWAAGVPLDWTKFYAEQRRRRVVLPTYPFERQRYWIEPPARAAVESPPANAVAGFSLAREIAALAGVEATLARDAELVEAPTYAAFSRELDAWCAVQLFHYVAAGAGEIAPGAQQARVELRERLGVQRPFWKCFDYFLHELAADGYLRLEGDDLVWLRAGRDVPSVERGREALLARYPEFKGIVRLVEHCTSHYPDALSGKIKAITVLYPEGRSDLLEETAKQNARHTNKAVYIRLLKETIERRLTQAGGRKVRILEVGVGDGLLASQLAPGLKGRNVEYVATDLSRAFVRKAEKSAAAAGLDFLQFQVLDIARDPLAQGFARASFDLIVCLDVVHATARLAETLSHLRTLLAPGGLFGVIEKVRSERWIDLVWGLAEGWWYFEDVEVRQHVPLLAATGWEKVLRGLPFAEVAVFPREATARAATDYALLLAQVPATKEEAAVEAAKAAPDISNWFYVAAWRRSVAPIGGGSGKWQGVVVGRDDFGLVEKLRACGAEVGQVSDLTRFRLAVDEPGQVKDLTYHIVVLPDALDIFALVELARALSATRRPVRLTLVSQGAWAVKAGDKMRPEQALLAGPLRVIPLELPHVVCRNIELDGGVEVDAVVAEIVEHAERVVAYRGGERWVQKIRAQPLPALASPAQGLRERGVYLITGAFGSMGLAFARDLARTVQARLVLVARSGPTDAQRQALAEIESLGGEVLCVQADVADVAALRAAVGQARARFGAIHGVVHTAGMYGQGLMWDRPRAAMEVTLAPKVAGTRALEEALAGERLDFFVLCSSLAALLPVPGQVDYCAANGFLDAFAADFTQRTGTRAISIGWGMWQELGMMDHTSLSEVQKRAVREEISREGWGDAGVAAFRRILAHGRATHIVVSPQSVRLAAAPTHPLFVERRAAAGGRVDYVARLQPSRHWVLDEHRLEGRSILPGTAYLELARAAWAEETDADAVELREVYFLSPLVFDGDEEKEVRVILRAGAFHIVSRSAAGAERWIEHARGEIAAVEGGTRPPGAWLEHDEQGKHLETVPLPADAVKFGPRWQCIREIAFGGQQGVAQMELASAFQGDLPMYALHPALLDMATGFITVRHPLPDSLPFSYRRVTVRGPLPMRFRSHVRVAARAETTLDLDAALTAENGDVLVEIEGYRLRRMAPQQIAQARPTTAVLDNARLTIGAQGFVDSLALVRAARRAPGPGEVEIQVEAAGLNFIEVLYALGMLPANAELENSFGLECAGRVVRAGEGSGFAAGDAVVAYANGCFAGYVTTPANAVARRPAGLSAEEAATLPAAFATAHYALVTQGRLAAGERVLIHAAAGGVGMAAVQIAQRIGAEVFATAGSPEKRAALSALGVKHVMDSRSVAFADEVTRLTGGRGVDVVLNSLGGEFMHRSLDLVAPHGRFLELGKRDLFKGGKLELKPFTKIISFLVIDVGPDLPGFAALWREVAARFASGEYRPLPHQAFALIDAAQAFEFMARAKHIGKIVLTIGDPAVLQKKAVAARPSATGQSIEAILGDAPAATSQPSANPAPISPAAHARPDGAGDYVAPADEVEEAIARVWQELLGVARVGARDNFFDLHGDSLLAAQVMARLHSALQVKLPLSALFDEPTVAGLAGRVRAARGVRKMQQAPVAAKTANEEEGEI